MVINNMCSIDISQYDIANYLGVNIPDGETIPFVFNIKKTDQNSNIGVIVTGNEINDLFEHFDIPLKETYKSAYRIYPDDFGLLVKKELLQNKSIICGFSYGYLYDKNNFDIGHVSIITNISDDYSSMFLLDPGPDDCGLKEVETNKLFSAIRLKRNGIWVISQKN
jgi:hypothetical protein